MKSVLRASCVEDYLGKYMGGYQENVKAPTDILSVALSN